MGPCSVETWSTPPAVHPKWPTPRGVVHTTTSGVYLKWSIPPGVVHTTTSGVYLKWSIPPGVVHTTTSGVHPKWPTPPPVACTQSGLHHEVWSAPAAVAYTTRCSGTHGLHRWSAAIHRVRQWIHDDLALGWNSLNLFTRKLMLMYH